MARDFITRDSLLSWLEDCRRRHLLVAPQKIENLLLFAPVKEISSIVLDYTNTQLSPKEWFLPRSEAILKVEGLKPSEWTLKPGDDIGDTMIFGMRPCDSWGIKILDKPYLSTPADSRYLERRQKTVTVGLACTSCQTSCFCTSMGTAPDDSSHNDIFFTPAGGGYKARATTEKGKELLALAKLEEKDVKTEPSPLPSTVPSNGVEQQFRSNFQSKYWDKVGDRCLHCNICSFVCPNCYCFDMRDLSITNGQGGYERIRAWESCQSPGFTKLAGGHNPRPSKGARIRQRFAHKLLYFHDEYGHYLCSGCGRCVWSCPVNIDIREIITDLQGIGNSDAGK